MRINQAFFKNKSKKFTELSSVGRLFFGGGEGVALTAKQERFVEEYLVDLNATQAAIRSGYSSKTAEQMGYQLLQKTSVQKALQEAIDKRSKRTGITQEKVIEEIGKIAFAKAHDYSDADLKYSNKLKALELLGKHLGMFDGKGAGAEQNLEDDPITKSLKEAADAIPKTD